MDSEDKKIVMISAICAGVFVMCFCTIFWYCSHRITKFTENGYDIQTLKGADYPHWVLPKENKNITPPDERRPDI